MLASMVSSGLLKELLACLVCTLQQLKSLAVLHSLLLDSCMMLYAGRFLWRMCWAAVG